MKTKPLTLLIIFEATLLGLATLVVFGFLADYYDRTKAAIAEQTVTAQETQVRVAFLASRSPTGTSTPTSTPTMTPSLTPTDIPYASPTPSSSPLPSTTPSPSLDPAMSRTPTATSPPGISPTSAPPPAPSGAWQTLSGCGVIDRAGNFRLGSDLVANGDCISIQTSHAVLDCGGHSIKGTSFAGIGIAVRKYGLLGNLSPSYVEIRNCRLSNFRFGILAEGANHLVIQRNESSNNYDDVDPKTRYGDFLGMTEGGGIRANNIADSTISGNTTLHQAIGIDVRYSSSVTIRDNTASDNSAWGINLYGSQNSQITGNATADNVRRCTWGAGDIGFGCDAGGIVLQGGSNNNTVSNNQVTGRNGNGIFIKAHAQPCGNNNTIISNTISSVMYNAVELGFCTGNKVNGNTIKMGLDGIWLGFAHDTEIRNNTITDMRNHGIISSNSWNNVVSGNQIINSNEGLYFYGEVYDGKTYSWLPPGDYRSHDNCLCANTFMNNLTTAVRIKDTTNNQVTNNVFQGNGRTVIQMGNTSGTSLTGNITSWAPLPLQGAVALDAGRLMREMAVGR